MEKRVMEFAIGNKPSLKELAWHLLRNLQTSNDKIKQTINTYPVWKYMIDEYHNSRFGIKHQIISFMSAFLFSGDKEFVAKFILPENDDENLEHVSRLKIAEISFLGCWHLHTWSQRLQVWFWKLHILITSNREFIILSRTCQELLSAHTERKLQRKANGEPSSQTSSKQLRVAHNSLRI